MPATVITASVCFCEQSDTCDQPCEAVPWLRRLVAGLSPRRPGFNPRSVLVGFVVNKMALRQVHIRTAAMFLHYIPHRYHFHETCVFHSLCYDVSVQDLSARSAAVHSAPQLECSPQTQEIKESSTAMSCCQTRVTPVAATQTAQ